MNRSRGRRDAKAAFEAMEPRLLLSTTFTDSTAAMGLPTSLPSQYLHASAVADVNGDGYLDVFYGSWKNEGPNRLYLTSGSPTLAESAQESINGPPGTPENGRTSGAAFADFDNDGDLDLVIANNYRSNAPTKNKLLSNNGSGIFTDVTSGSNLDSTNMSARNTFIIDYNGDGLLDILLQDDVFGGTDHSRLMRNDGGMVFTERTTQAGLPSNLWGLGGAVGDFNGDGWQDFINVGTVSGTYRADIRLYINDQDDTFHQATNYNFNSNWPWYGNNEDWTCGAAVGTWTW